MTTEAADPWRRPASLRPPIRLPPAPRRDDRIHPDPGRGAGRRARGVRQLSSRCSARSPLDLYFYMYQGAFGTWFSWQNTLTRAAPLILTALCTALPAQLGMVIIGGEGALLIGALAATAARRWRCRRAAARGAARDGARRRDRRRPLDHAVGRRCGTIAASTRRSRACCWSISRSRSSTISSKGVMRDPTSLNKPSTREIGAANMIGTIPGTDVHWGLVFGRRRGGGLPTS